MSVITENAMANCQTIPPRVRRLPKDIVWVGVQGGYRQLGMRSRLISGRPSPSSFRRELVPPPVCAFFCVFEAHPAELLVCTLMPRPPFGVMQLEGPA